MQRPADGQGYRRSTASTSPERTRTAARARCSTSTPRPRVHVPYIDISHTSKLECRKGANAVEQRDGASSRPGMCPACRDASRACPLSLRVKYGASTNGDLVGESHQAHPDIDSTTARETRTRAGVARRREALTSPASIAVESDEARSWSVLYVFARGHLTGSSCLPRRHIRYMSERRRGMSELPTGARGVCV
ncbi:hypothetical protein FKP32DRAFT_1283283 [Trametes sanguinea]|nr:hypothetical protein FKP32DRAFT_1283283 [Trametes sanguinea]